MIETYNIITIGVLDEDKKLVGITEENFKKLYEKMRHSIYAKFQYDIGA